MDPVIPLPVREASPCYWQRNTDDEIRMYGHAYGTWLPIDLARNLTKQLQEMGWRVTPPGEVTT